ncbi:nad-dependent epimerase dehydratase [Colletotrichum truncatum]|uniref:Nad-dependent epimerase dehydratase n=1 Tax=Colletotrichum truncatum TaxID=5467 RepID=A0ACC3ZB44_COLTU|nr:nad-dependent epimerase dehydratase [Colletotrichum truncatum]KAF6783170.1 nad-dependent epimerase dehydratase [Colletotrichum truncatum]
MHIFIIGATGRNGALILAECLSREHTVTALVRDPSSVVPQQQQQHPNLTLVRGTPLSPADVRKAMSTPPGAPPDAVIVALNIRRQSESPFAAIHPDTPPTLTHDAVSNVLQVLKEDHHHHSPGPRKVVINSMQGSGVSNASLNLPFRVLFQHTSMKYTVSDHDAVDALVRGKEGEGVNWVLVRPPMLTEGESLPVKVYDDDGKGVRWLPRITRKSVATFMVDAAEKPDWDRRAPVITN